MKRFLLLLLLLIPSVAAARSEQARLTAARADLAGIETAFDAFAADCGRYPTTVEGFSALLNSPTNLPVSRWRGPYLEHKPTDPWGDDFVYRYPGIHNTNSFDLYSCGANGISKSGGNDLDDINNWDANSPHGGDYPRLGLLGELGNYPALLAFWLIFQVFLIFGATQLVAFFVSRRVGNTAAQHQIVRLIWFVAAFVSLLLLLYCLLVPRIA